MYSKACFSKCLLVPLFFPLLYQRLQFIQKANSGCVYLNEKRPAESANLN